MSKIGMTLVMSTCLLSFITIGWKANSLLDVRGLKCQSISNPVGISIDHPVFSWITGSREKGQRQTAYQIIIADNEQDINQNRGNVWDSGKVDSGQSNAVSYSGSSLQSDHNYFWKVKIWDNQGNPGEFTNAATFLTSIIDPNLWSARWIGEGSGTDPQNIQKFYDKPVKGDSGKYQENSLLLRKKCQISKPVTKAILHICGLGLYELTINGEVIGTKVLNPAKTNYNKIVLYDTYEITKFLKGGENVLGVMLGNGWFNPIPKWWSWRMQWFGEKRAMVQMHVIYGDGSSEIITTDNSWKIAEGPVRKHCIYDGEIYDANKETKGWNKPGFDDSTWAGAKTVNPPNGKLTAQIMPAIKRIGKFKPVVVTYPESNVSLVDFGQNFSGWVHIRLKGAKGDSIHIRYAEDIKNGKLDPTTNHWALVKDTYIAKGGNQEHYEPRFTYHGFQYVEISGLKYKLLPSDIEGIVIHSSVEPSGTFECSNEQINKIHKAVVWSQRANLMGYPTDCPQREERLGWLGDAHVTAEEAIYNFDMNLFYCKWLNDIKVNQEPGGDIPFIAPRPISEGPAVAWSSGFHLIVWYYYLYYGDVKILSDNFESMKKYVNFLSTLADDYILPTDKYGDWVALSAGWKRGLPLSTSTGYYYYITTILAKTSRILGFMNDAKTYEELAENIRLAYNKRFYNAGTKNYDDGSQFANSFALFLKLVPENEKKGVLDQLINDIVKTNNGHLTTGILGTKYMMELLSEAGRSDIAWLLATQTSYPGWLNMLGNHNTFSEHWIEKGMNSHNHVMFGSIDSWFYKTLGGIQVDETAPGFRNIIIKPYMPAGLTWVKASTKTVRGLVRSEWTKNQQNYSLNVEVPVGSNATVYVLAKSPDLIKEGGLPVNKVKNATFLRMEDNYAVFQIGSGTYRFASTYSE